MNSDPRASLIHVLRAAYSGELAAAIAYEGHRDSISSIAEKAELEKIRLEELHHRERVGAMLHSLGAAPSRFREWRMRLIGMTISLLCRLGGWYVPMYGAGRIESRNIIEYLEAARFAEAAGRPELVAELLQMAQVERDHEAYFRAKIEKHWLCRWVRPWPKPE